MLAKGQSLADEQILGMNWLVEGVQGKIGNRPHARALARRAPALRRRRPARYEEDGLLVVGPDADGRQVVRAAGAYRRAGAPTSPACRRRTCRAASSRRASSTCTCTFRRPT